MRSIFDMLDELYLDNSLSRWLWAIGAALLLWMVLGLLRRLARRRHAELAQTAAVELLELPLLIASRTTASFLFILSTFGGFMLLKTPSHVHAIAEKVLLIASCWQVGIWATTGALAWINLKHTKSLIVQDQAAAGSLGIINILVRMVIWSVVLLLTLDNMGVKVTTLVAGLGIGGIAVALAVQNVLGDLLASFSIMLDKPFMVGDALGVDDISGTVEQIGIKTTRLRSVSGEQIIIPNADLLKSRVRNFKRMTERRVLFNIAVSYTTPRTKLAQLPEKIRAIVTAQAQVRFDRCHIARYTANAIEIEAVYFMQLADYARYMDTQQTVLLAIHELLESEQIEFAFNNQKLVLAGANP